MLIIRCIDCNPLYGGSGVWVERCERGRKEGRKEGN